MVKIKRGDKVIFSPNPSYHTECCKKLWEENGLIPEETYEVEKVGIYGNNTVITLKGGQSVGEGHLKLVTQN